MLDAAVEAPAPTGEEPATFSDYVPCDACRVARALWKISGDSGDLYLCGHHKNKFEPKLAEWAKAMLEFTP